LYPLGLAFNWTESELSKRVDGVCRHIHNNLQGALMLNFDRSLVFLLVLGLLGASLLVLLPFFSALFWAGLLAFATWPLMTLLTRLLGGRTTLAASVLTLTWFLLVAIPLLALGFNLADHVRDLQGVVADLKADGFPPVPDWMPGIPMVGQYLVDSWQFVDLQSAALLVWVKPHLGQIGTWLLSKSAALGGGVLELLLSLFLVFFFYRDGPAIARFANSLLERLIGERAAHYQSLISGTVQRVVNGVIGTAVAQGLVAMVGFWIAGVPGAVMLGVLTFFLSFLPAAPPLVWLPAIGWLVFKGDYGFAAFMGFWGVFIISGVDNVLKPYLISRGGTLPLVIVLIGITGGLLCFGLMGLFIGPTLLAIMFSLMKDWTAPKEYIVDSLVIKE
jgi:predicted PurR-regulated permease PerM